jgi:hypothetical protein
MDGPIPAGGRLVRLHKCGQGLSKAQSFKSDVVHEGRRTVACHGVLRGDGTFAFDGQ